jgi:hydroxymethylbilane synthase
VTGTLRIVSRGSELALWQSRAVASALHAAVPGLATEIRVVRTTGDKILDVPLAKIGDKGLFTKELDQALLAGEADLAVHSLKDVPTRLPEGLVVAAVSTREDPRDVLLVREGVEGSGLASLPAGARVGTSSLRRRAQLRALRPDLEVLDLRGNLNTRLAKLDGGAYDAIVLAAAGVLRLGWAARIAAFLEPEEWLPAVGQGALAIVTRAGRDDLRDLLSVVHDPLAAACTEAERAFLAGLEGGCQVPIGALATVSDGFLVLGGLVASLDGATILRDQEGGAPDDASAIGTRLAARLTGMGAGRILDSIRSAAPGGVEQAAAP